MQFRCISKATLRDQLRSHPDRDFTASQIHFQEKGASLIFQVQQLALAKQAQFPWLVWGNGSYL
jgi:hypothetical protein